MISGIIVYAIDHRQLQKNVFPYVIFGVVGSIVGGLIALLIFGIEITGFNIVSFSIAMWSGLLLLIVVKSVQAVK